MKEIFQVLNWLKGPKRQSPRQDSHRLSHRTACVQCSALKRCESRRWSRVEMFMFVSVCNSYCVDVPNKSGNISGYLKLAKNVLYRSSVTPSNSLSNNSDILCIIKHVIIISSALLFGIIRA